MKRILKLGSRTILIVMGLIGLVAAGMHYDGVVFDRQNAAINFNENIIVENDDRFSIQAVYSTGTAPGHTFIDGAKSTVQLTVVGVTSLVGQTIQIGTVSFTFGGSVNTATTISTQPNTSAQAAHISSAIVAVGGALSGLVVSSNTAAVVYATSTFVGNVQRYVISSSTNLVWSHSYFQGGLDPDVDLATETITEANHGFSTGLRVLISTTTGNAVPTGLNNGTTYYAIKVTDSKYALATTSTTAAAGTRIDLTALRGGSTISATPMPFSAGLAGFQWQASNDGVNYVNLPTASFSSVTFNGTAGTTLWDFQYFNYKILRMFFTGPTAGGVNVTVTKSAKRD